jgi:formate dehydrogenase major subunit
MQINITFNGKQIACDSNQTIVEVAKEQGAFVPTLCHDNKLEPYGSCWVCLVEVKNARGFVPACATKVMDGMVVETDNERIRAARQMALGLLLSNHSGDCIGPCVDTCPAGCDVQGYTALVANGMEAEAIKLIKETLPLPASLGRVCPHPCETECRRNLVEEPVSICYLKRHAADFDLNSGKPYMPSVAPDTGKKVAVVGAGPAGLTAAYYLRQKGHKVTIFEALPKSGGWLRYGIPQYRLPKEVLDQEVKTITDLGVEIKYNQRLGKDITLEGLKSQYDAVFLGMGAHASSKMGVENEEDRGVIAGIEFLKRLTMGEKFDVGKKVAVIGGGNTAIDAARTSLRLGAEEVFIVYRRSEKEMPANPFEIEEAKHEGVKFQFLTAPTRVIACTHDKSGAISCQKMELGEPDASGRRRPVPVSGSDFHIEADLIISCIGQSPDLSGLGQNHNLKITRWTTLETDPETGATADPKVFAAGDMATGAATVVEAIGGAHKAALAMDEYLKTGKIAKKIKQYNITKGKINQVPKDMFADRPKAAKAKMPMLEPSQRRNFDEVEKGFSRITAIEEAKRCLECGCADMQECRLRDYATVYDVMVQRFMGEVKQHPIDDSHPFLVRDQSKCVMCGRCVRMCLEVVGASALGFVYRGFNAIVAPTMEKPYPESPCVSCGACIDTCPVGALTERVRHIKPSPWKMEPVPSVCTFCGVGCGLDLNIKDNKVVRVVGSEDSPVNKGSLCFKGKFGFELIHSAERLTTPKAKAGAKHKEFSWAEAISKVNSDIDAVAKKYGQDSVAVFASGRTSIEEAEGLRSWAEKKGIKQFGSFSGGNVSDIMTEVLGSSTGKGYQSLSETKNILLIGSDTYAEHPVFSQMIRKAVKSGAKLYSLQEKATKLGEIAAQELAVKKGGISFALNGVLKNLLAKCQSKYSGYKELVKALGKLSAALATTNSGLKKADIDGLTKLLLEDNDCMLVFNAGAADAETVKAVANILLLLDKPENFIALRSKANDSGIERFVNADISGILKGKIKAAVLLNEDPVGSLEDGPKIKTALAKLEKLVVCDLFLTETAKLADIVLPASSFAEGDGSFINSEGRLQHFKAGIAPVSGKTTRQVLVDLGGAPLPNLPKEKAGQKQFGLPTLKKGQALKAGYASDVMERKAVELKKKEGLIR